MIMQDHIKATERLNFDDVKHDFYLEECVGCGRDSNQIVKDDGCSYIELEREAITLDCGLWYCHPDCYKGSR
jgi:hypothetical protein